ncbi:hypothetical protein J437_LFUL011011 [Ladona fulva]|uniref:Cuticle protein CPCFC domain-containing protein n=1 Tax=Ladona fulva TaxID=123851 RepID=A0A8K0KL24_LADFU|nr:hypothetical protein J437_LFUL011011 [Ladona fulva]
MPCFRQFILVLSAIATASAAISAAKYPAGVDPHTCPNYPNCDNVALAAHATGAPHAPYAAPAYSAYGHAAGVPGAAAAYPAGVDPHACPNYPYCGPTPAHVPGAAPHNSWAAPAAHNPWVAPAVNNAWAAHNGWAAAPATGHDGNHYPAGVSPHSCPNYPYCH